MYGKKKVYADRTLEILKGEPLNVIILGFLRNTIIIGVHCDRRGYKYVQIGKIYMCVSKEEIEKIKSYSILRDRPYANVEYFGNIVSTCHENRRDYNEMVWVEPTLVGRVCYKKAAKWLDGLFHLEDPIFYCQSLKRNLGLAAREENLEKLLLKKEEVQLTLV